MKDGSKAARQEPTPKGYHTGPRAAGRVPAATGCALSRKRCGMHHGIIEGPKKQLRLKKAYGNELRWGTPACWLLVHMVDECFGFFQAALQIRGSFDGE